MAVSKSCHCGRHSHVVVSMVVSTYCMLGFGDLLCGCLKQDCVTMQAEEVKATIRSKVPTFSSPKARKKTHNGFAGSTAMMY